MSKPVNIVVMLGGAGSERAVSLRSGAGVAAALRSLGHGVTELDPQQGCFELPVSTDVVFLALHGSYGEDGTVQGQLDKIGVPYTGSDATASRLAFDKVLTKQQCVLAGVPTAKFTVVDSETTPWPMGWQPPVVVKPVRQGSSVGLRHDSQLLVEERILGRETTVGILDGTILPVVEVRPKSGQFDYRNKYTPGNTEYFCPAQMDAAMTARIQEAALGAFRAVGGRDYARVDVMVRSSGEPVVLEVNTLPGMTPTSLLPLAAAAAGINYETLCQRMVDLALGRKPFNQ